MLASSKVTVWLTAEPGLEAKILGQQAIKHGTSLKYSLWQCFYSCTLKMRSSCKVRAKSLSKYLREEEENDGLYNCWNHTSHSVYRMED